jgi:hypothetical protein
MKNVLIFAAVCETATGLALLIVPSLVGRLLLGEELTGVAIPVARVTGIAVISLGVACWPGPPLAAMLTYSALVALYLAYLGFAGGLIGVFLWPAVALHAVLSILLGRAWLATAARLGSSPFYRKLNVRLGDLFAGHVISFPIFIMGPIFSGRKE